MKAIFACTKSGGIGFNNSMPWPHDKKDLQRFKSLTLNSTIVMGRNTWESLENYRPLPHRQNIVVSSRPLILPDEVIRIDDLASLDILDDLKVDWVIGGAKLFDSLFDRVSEIHLSILHKDYECDTFIDIHQIKTEFELIESELNETHTYEIYKRNRRKK